MSISIYPTRDFIAICAHCGWSERGFDRNDAISKARGHRTENHNGMVSITSRSGSTIVHARTKETRAVHA
jgi:hypothetical protein